MDELIGRTLNRFKIVELLGEGGLGAVFRAQDTVLERNVAVKVMRPEYARQATFRERFLQEARAAARLDHPGIVEVHDFGQEGDLLYIIMEFIPGDNLREMLQKLRTQNKWVLLTEAVQVVRQVALAIDYAHNQGVLHRDIKPANLMLKPEVSEGLPYRVVITDLGLAQLTGDAQPAREAISIGTPAYMSPEQALGRPTDARSDVYSLGVLLYELAVGRTPYPARTISEVVQQQREQPVPTPRSIRPDLPEALERVILKALRRDPAQRYSDARTLAEAIQEAVPSVREAVFIPQNVEDTVSLVTQYEDNVSDETVPMDAEGVTPPAFIDVELPNEPPRTFEIKSLATSIGRERENDITIDVPRVSRQHARLQYDGNSYWISDLNSLNGTFLGSRRLVPGEPVIWPPNSIVQIGDARLRLRVGGTTFEETLPVPGQQTVAMQTTPAATVPSAGAGPGSLGLYLENAQVSVVPGSASTLGVVVQNRGASLEEFRISVDGIPVNWLPAPPPVVRVVPGGQQEVRLTIRPPQAPTTRPGRYPFTVRATSLSDPSKTAQQPATLSVGVFSQFTAEVSPRRVYPEDPILVTVQNQGNAAETFTIDLGDQVGDLAFNPPSTRLTLQEGQTGTVEFIGAPRRRRLFGSPTPQMFTARVTSARGEVKTSVSELVTSGIIPPFVVPILLVLCLCLTALAAYEYIDIFSPPTEARQTAVAMTEAAGATQAALVGANQATLAAATATAEWLVGDLDRDGLANADELRLNTNPNLADTDGDGLTDGFEVNQIVCANPTNPDTDGDGFDDRIDPDPCNLTPTPPPPTLTFTPPPSTSTPSVTPAPNTATATQAPATNTLTPPPPTATFTQLPATVTNTSAAPTATPVGGGYLVEFSSNRDGNFEIYAMLADGTRQTRVTNQPGSDFGPVLHPDGTHVVFVSNRDGNLEVYLMNVDGSGQTRLTNNTADDYSPTWSPNGNSIVFVSERDGNAEIYTMNADGSGQTRLTTRDGDDLNPAFSPDSSRVVFDGAAGEGRDIFVMDADGSDQAQLTSETNQNQDPDWSPIGNRIIFVSNRGGIFDVYVMDADGSDQAKVTSLPGDASSPAWSRDGQWIAFSAPLGSAGEIFIVRADGSQQSNLTNHPADDIDPTW